MDTWPGQPSPLGATYDGAGTNFALYSEVADGVELCLFDDDGNEKRIDLPQVTASTWHGYIPGVGPGQRYGVRVHGPPDAGCNPAKLLLDPYAKAVWGEVTWNPALFPALPGAPPSARDLDSAPYVPQAVVADPWFDWGDDRPPRTPGPETIVYETHVKRLTARHPGVPEELRGTYAGLAHPAAVDHLTRTGITAVALLPIHQFVAGAPGPQPGADDRGPDPIGFFAPHNGYAAWPRPGQVAQEFRHMVKALHAAGIEIFLDVVYHRTAECAVPGPILSLRGIDSAYFQPGGNGGTLNLRHPAVLRMVMDSLRYWVQELHVDGFRFSSAPALDRQFGEADGVSPFFGLLQQDPVVGQVKLIAEPRAGGDDRDPLGRFPACWSEWNHRYRDTVRDYWRGRTVPLPEFAARLGGSPDLYAGNGRLPYASINFVTAHGGPTLADLVAASDHPEGDHPEVVALGDRRRRSLLATLFLSQGIPLLLGGDEMGRSLGGRDDTRAGEEEASWYDWDAPDTVMAEFTRRLIGVRRRHPLLRRRVPPGQPAGDRNVAWFTPEGAEITGPGWPAADSSAVAVFLDGEAVGSLSARGERVVDDSLLALFNASARSVRFTIPTGPWGRRWTLVFDTGVPDDEEGACSYKSGDAVLVEDRSVVLLRRRFAPGGAQDTAAAPSRAWPASQPISVASPHRRSRS